MILTKTRAGVMRAGGGDLPFRDSLRGRDGDRAHCERRRRISFDAGRQAAAKCAVCV